MLIFMPIDTFSFVFNKYLGLKPVRWAIMSFLRMKDDWIWETGRAEMSRTATWLGVRNALVTKT